MIQEVFSQEISLEEKIGTDTDKINILWIILPTALGILFIIMIAVCIIGIYIMKKKHLNQERDVQIRGGERDIPNLDRNPQNVIFSEQNFNIVGNPEVQLPYSDQPASPPVI